MTMRTWEEVYPVPPSRSQHPQAYPVTHADRSRNASLVSQLSGLCGVGGGGQESGLCPREARVTPAEGKFLWGHGHPEQAVHVEKVPRTGEYLVSQESRGSVPLG